MDKMRELWGHSIKRAGLGIPDPTKHSQHCQSTLLQCCDMLVSSILGKEELEYRAHKECVQLGSWAAMQSRLQQEMVEVGRQQVGGKEVEHKLTRAMQTGAWLTVIPNCMNGTALLAEEFRDNFCLRYGMQSLHLSKRCDGYGTKFSVEHSLMYSKGGLVLVQHNDLNKEWGALGAWALTHSAVTYKPTIYS
eukprot:10266882-Ditylum_brightwellii.AAC.1